MLDTHVLVWAWLQPNLLSRAVRALFAARADAFFVSAVTAYEIENKRDRDPELSKLPFALEEAVTEDGLTWLSVTPDDAIAATRLPKLHADPWDRILIAQTINIGATLITRDARIREYAVPVLW